MCKTDTGKFDKDMVLLYHWICGKYVSESVPKGCNSDTDRKHKNRCKPVRDACGVVNEKEEAHGKQNQSKAVK